MASLHLPLYGFSSSSSLNPKFESRLKERSFLPTPFCRRRSSLPLRVPPPPRCLSVDVDRESRDAKSESVGAADSRVPVDPRRAEEVFAVRDTGKWGCRSCGYVYDQDLGDSSYPVSPGTEFDRLPENWRCPTCGAAKSYFNSKSVEVAGFVVNQKFGLGGNSLTSGQKSILIYGSLLAFFLLFLSGYFLQ